VRGARLAFDLAVITDCAQEALAEARALVAEGARLDIEGRLADILTSLAARFTRETGIDVVTYAEVPDALPEALRILAMRVAQEGLANVRKHAGAAHAWVRAVVARQVLTIEVVDDGAGPSNTDPLSGGFGLSGLQDRVTSLGGQLEFSARLDGNGSVLLVRVDTMSPAIPADPPSAQPTESIAVLVVDDHAIVRRGLVELLRDEPGIDVVGEAETGEEAVRLALETAPDVVMMDLAMPGRGGVWAISQILADSARAGRTTRVVAVTVFETDGRIVEAMQAGAVEYLVKASSAETFVNAVRRVAAGHPALSADVKEVLENGKSRLSRREVEILRLVAAGLSNIEIAEELTVQPSTIKTMLQRTYLKLDVPDRAAAVAEALRRDLI
jgi:DNA-binding NarL/FixJ family response regulator